MSSQIRPSDFQNFSDKELNQYFDNHSFVKEFKFENMSLDRCIETITDQQKEILLRLINLNNQRTIYEVKQTPTVRYFLINELKIYFNKRSPKNLKEKLFQVLETVDKVLGSISQRNLLQTIHFINKNFDSIILQSIPSTKRPDICKFSATQHGLPFNLYVEVKKQLSLTVKLIDIGQGRFKNVNVCVSFLSSDLKMKIVAKQLNSEIAKQELKMLNLAAGLPHIIPLESAEVYFSSPNYKQVTVFPVCCMGDLSNHLASPKICRQKKLKIIADILEGVSGLHERGIIHRDIKPANIFLNKVIENEEEIFQVFIGDFGFACLKEKDFTRNHVRGSPLYMPVDLLKVKVASDRPQKVATSDYDMDNWALGITIWEILYGKHSWDNFISVEMLIWAIEELNDPLNHLEPEDNTINHVIWQLLQVDPSKRITAKDAWQKVLKLIS